FFKIVSSYSSTLALSSVSSSRVFMDYDIQPTIDYFNWLVLMYATVLCFDIFE
ncbi:unnamed protein product, partial [Brassica rapa]